MVNNMGKRFVTKKNNNSLIRIIITLGIIYIILNFIIAKIKGNVDESILSKTILNVYSNKLDIKLDKLDLNNPEIILRTALNYSDIIKLEKKNNETTEVFKENEKLGRIYIYNTHQTEEYDAGTLLNYNKNLTVYTASEILKSKLERYNIDVFVEERNVKEYLNKYNLAYKDSYKITREFLNSSPSDIDLYIDLHRDSANRSVTAVNINNKNYAKVMFVVGTNYTNYNLNLDLSSKLNNLFIEFSPNITRGIYTRHSVYNQDFSPNVILLELGGPYNTLDEIENTLIVFAEVINKYLGGS